MSYYFNTGDTYTTDKYGNQSILYDGANFCIISDNDQYNINTNDGSIISSDGIQLYGSLTQPNGNILTNSGDIASELSILANKYTEIKKFRWNKIYLAPIPVISSNTANVYNTNDIYDIPKIILKTGPNFGDTSSLYYDGTTFFLIFNGDRYNVNLTDGSIISSDGTQINGYITNGIGNLLTDPNDIAIELQNIINIFNKMPSFFKQESITWKNLYDITTVSVEPVIPLDAIEPVIPLDAIEPVIPLDAIEPTTATLYNMTDIYTPIPLIEEAGQKGGQNPGDTYTLYYDGTIFCIIMNKDRYNINLQDGSIITSDGTKLYGSITQSDGNVLTDPNDIAKILKNIINTFNKKPSFFKQETLTWYNVYDASIEANVVEPKAVEPVQSAETPPTKVLQPSDLPVAIPTQPIADSSADQTATISRKLPGGMLEIPGDYSNADPVQYIDANGTYNDIVTNGDITTALTLVDIQNMRNINTLNDVTSLQNMLNTVDSQILGLLSQGYVWQNASSQNLYLYPYRLQLINKIASIQKGGKRRRRTRKSRNCIDKKNKSRK